MVSTTRTPYPVTLAHVVATRLNHQLTALSKERSTLDFGWWALKLSTLILRELTTFFFHTIGLEGPSTRFRFIRLPVQLSCNLKDNLKTMHIIQYYWRGMLFACCGEISSCSHLVKIVFVFRIGLQHAYYVLPEAITTFSFSGTCCW